MQEDISSLLLLGEFDLILIFVVPILFTIYGVFVSKKANISTVELGSAFIWAYAPIAALIIATLILAMDQRPSDLAISLTSNSGTQLNCPIDVSPAAEHASILYNDDLKGCNFTVKFKSRFSHYESVLYWVIFALFL